MAIIKGSQAHVFRPGRLDLGDLRQQGQEILAQARAEANELIEATRTIASRMGDEAREKGFAEGREQGMAEGRTAGECVGRAEALEERRSQIDAMLASWAEVLETWEGGRRAMLNGAREDVLELALTLGRMVTHSMVAVDPECVTKQVEEALAMVVTPSGVTICIHPEDRPIIESVLEQLVDRFRQCTDVSLKDDETIDRGGCLLRTGRGHIDATVRRQLERITIALLGRSLPDEPPDDGTAS